VFAQEEVIVITTVEDNPDLVENNLGHEDTHLTNAHSVMVAVINENNKVVDLIKAGDVLVSVTCNPVKWELHVNLRSKI
jgi:hypothetical protein